MKMVLGWLLFMSLCLVLIVLAVATDRKFTEGIVFCCLISAIFPLCCSLVLIGSDWVQFAAFGVALFFILSCGWGRIVQMAINYQLEERQRYGIQTYGLVVSTGGISADGSCLVWAFGQEWKAAFSTWPVSFGNKVLVEKVCSHGEKLIVRTAEK